MSNYPPSNLSKKQMELLMNQQGDEIRRLRGLLKTSEVRATRFFSLVTC